MVPDFSQVHYRKKGLLIADIKLDLCTAGAWDSGNLHKGAERSNLSGAQDRAWAELLEMVGVQPDSNVCMDCVVVPFPLFVI